MRVCVLTDETIEEFNPSRYLHEYEWEIATMQLPVFEFIQDVSLRKPFDVYLNIFDGFESDDTSGPDVVRSLELLGLPFTGADSKFFDPTREEMQAVAGASGLNFARGFHAQSNLDLSKADALHFPLIVKHPNSFASTGLIPESRVDTKDQLFEQCQRMVSEFGAARVEEFIEGREVSCLVVDNPDDLLNPYAYPPAEVSFPKGETFLHEELKWFNWDTYIVPLEGQDILLNVQDVCRKMYLAMNGVGYARIDLRVRPDGELVILEINPNCGILYYGPDDRSSTDLPISWDKDGHPGFLNRIFRSAILRHKMRSAKI